jgi:transposase
MQTLNITQKYYTKELNKLQLKMNLDVGVLIPQDDSVRLLRNIVEEMDFSKVYGAYSEKGRKPAVSPITMFEIIVYAYMNRIFSSRDIEKACRRDINFIWLLDGQPAPDHTTISRFRDERLIEHMEDLFYQFVDLIFKAGELKFKNIFIDGTKIEAYANRYSFVWKKSVEKNMEKLIEKVELLLNQYESSIDYPAEGIGHCSALKQVKYHLLGQIKEQNIIFVKGIGHRKSQLQREYETVVEYLTRLEGYEDSLRKMNGRNSYSKTDNDATFMRMKEDHMRNGQLKPGYNAQVASEGGYIVGVMLSQERSDVNTLIPFLERIHGKTGKKFSSLIADSGYESEQNYVYLKTNKMTTYIKPSNYEIRKTRKFKNDIGRRENMTYLPEEDVYVCANNCKLVFSGIRRAKSTSGYIVEKKRYSCSQCENCTQSNKCLKKAKLKTIEFSTTFDELRKESDANIKSSEGIMLRINRSIQAEGVFAYMKEDLGYRRFRHRGKKHVENDMLLLAFAINLNRLHNKIQNEKLGYLEYKIA